MNPKTFWGEVLKFLRWPSRTEGNSGRKGHSLDVYACGNGWGIFGDGDTYGGERMWRDKKKEEGEAFERLFESHVHHASYKGRGGGGAA